MTSETLPHKLRIFISYSHANTAVRAALTTAFRHNDEFEVRHDTGEDKLAMELHREISNNLNWCDIVVPIVTEQLLNSHECRDELVRAHERRRRIVLFQIESLPATARATMPHFLKDQLYVEWSERSLDVGIETLKARIRTFSYEGWRQECFRHVKKIGDHLATRDRIPKWKTTILKHIVSGASENIRKVTTVNDCDFDISNEFSYLQLGGPLFAGASSITAICIAEVSTFWINPAFKDRATQYLKHQVKSAHSVRRLFVFKSPSEVNTYKNVLQAHYEFYGHRSGSNGVFYCSVDSYRKLRQRWSLETVRELSEDFGVLHFDDGSNVEVSLTSQHFRYRLYHPDSENNSRDELVLEQFDCFSQIEEGCIDGETNVARWSGDLLHTPQKLADVLEQLFDVRSDIGRVQHYVCIRADRDRDQIEALLLDLLSQFEVHRSSLQIVRSSFFYRLSVVAHDGRYHGLLRINEDFDFKLLLEFESRAALMNYYQHDVHSVERERLYCALIPELEVIYNQIRQSSNAKHRAKLFDTIEGTVSERGVVKRFDVVENEPLGSIVRHKGVPFGNHEA